LIYRHRKEAGDKEGIREGKNISSKEGIMRIKKKIGLVILLAAFMVAPFTLTEAAETSGSASVDILTDYVWRGQTLSGDDGVVQPSVGVTYGNLGANLWANYDIETDEQNETDLTLTYGLSKDKLSLEVGYIYYALDGTVSPSVILYYDFDEGDGAFLVASVGYSIGLADKVSLDLGASASINLDNEIMGVDTDRDPFTDFYNGEVTASVSVPVGKNLSIEPKIAYSFPLSSDAEDVFEGLPSGESDILYGGVGVSLGF
jgi:hypothetical protein